MALMNIRAALSNRLARRALGVGGVAALGGLGYSGMRGMGARGGGREESPEAYGERTSDYVLDPLAWEQMRQQVTDAMRAVSIYSVMPDIDPQRAELAKKYQPAFARLRGAGSLVRAGDLSKAIEGIEAIDAGTGAPLRQRLEKLLPARDRDIDESLGTTLGGVGGTLAGLLLTRGKSPRLASNALKALGVGGAAAAGAIGGGLAQNASQSVMTGEDVSSQVGSGLLAGSIGLAAAGGRTGLRRLARDAAIRSARIEMARPRVDQSLPYFDRIAAEQDALRQARNVASSIPSDAQLAAPLLLHMERSLEAAGRPRMLTSANDEGAIANLLRRQGRSKGAERAIGGLNEAYRGLLTDFDLGGGRIPELRLLEPDVVDPRALTEIESKIGTAVGERKTVERSIARRGLERVVQRLGELESKRGGLSPTERYESRLLRDRFIRLKQQEATRAAGEMSPAMLKRRSQQMLNVAPSKGGGDELLAKAREAQGAILTEAALKNQRQTWQARINRLMSETAVRREMDKVTQRLNQRPPMPEQQMLRAIMTDLQMRLRLVEGRIKLSPQAKHLRRLTKKTTRKPKGSRNILRDPNPEGMP